MQVKTTVTQALKAASSVLTKITGAQPFKSKRKNPLHLDTPNNAPSDTSSKRNRVHTNPKPNPNLSEPSEPSRDRVSAPLTSLPSLTLEPGSGCSLSAVPTQNVNPGPISTLTPDSIFSNPVSKLKHAETAQSISNNTQGNASSGGSHGHNGAKQLRKPPYKHPCKGYTTIGAAESRWSCPAGVPSTYHPFEVPD